MARVFLITGCSSGFGHELVQRVLESGNIAVATSRNPSTLSFPDASNENFLPIEMDILNSDSISRGFEQAFAAFGRVDVVINNAGYGCIGPFEELTDAQMSKQMDVNYFGVVKVTRKALQVMREQSPPGGLIQQITSIGGQRGMPLFSAYCASKWAVEGFTEAVSAEVKPEWGIRLCCVEPGGFRTNWAGSSMEFPESRHPAYNHLNAREKLGARHNTEEGDPVKASHAMYELAMMKDPPSRMVLGSEAYNAMQGKLQDYSKLYNDVGWKEFAYKCDVEDHVAQ